MKKIAIIGLFNSGSTVIAGVLERLGVYLGAPLWMPYYEPLDLKTELVQWWNEPHIQEKAEKQYRVSYLEAWLQHHRADPATPIAIKHPLLCMSASDVIEAWGVDTRFIWAHRSLEESIQRLTVRAWYAPEISASMQTTLFTAATGFFQSVEHLKVGCTDMRRNKHHEIDRIIEYLQLTPTARQVNDAAEFVNPPTKVAGTDRN